MKTEKKKHTIPAKTKAEKEVVLSMRLERDLLDRANEMNQEGARYLVDAYYQMQKQRLTSQGQLRALHQGVDDPPPTVLSWLYHHNKRLEDQVKEALKTFAEAHDMGRWAMNVVGIGPVISAGLIAHIDITQAPTVGHIWSFAGLNPDSHWDKGSKRPWNAQLKVLCYHAGECFKRTHSREGSVYGQIYVRRKIQEVNKNNALEFKDQAAHKLKTQKIKDKDMRKTLEGGKLTDGHLDRRACRYAAKMFLADWHHEAFRAHYGTEPPKPYVFDHLEGHKHYRVPGTLDVQNIDAVEKMG
jgi:hypothetical protein